MMQGIEIVPFREEYAERIAQLEKSCFSDPWSENAFRQLPQKSYCHYLVALADKVPAGFAGMVVLGDEGDIDKVMVDQAFRKCGIADAMLKELFRLGGELGVKAYTLEVRAGNAPAIALYQKNGFSGEGIRPGFYEKPKEDALIMWRREE